MLTMARTADTGPAFELHRFTVAAAGAEVVLLELEVRWPEGVPAAGRSRLLAGDEDEPVRVSPAAESVRGRMWRATFAVPAEAARGPLAIAAGGYVVDLPDPDPPGPEDERIARLAREGNSLRRRLDVAEEAAAHADALTRERDGLRADLEGVQGELLRVRDHAEREREREERRIADLQADLVAAAEEREAERAAVAQEREAERAQAQEHHDAELAAVREAYEAQLASLNEQLGAERAAAQADLEQHLEAERGRLESELARAHAEHRTQREALEARVAEVDAQRRDAESALTGAAEAHAVELQRLEEALAAAQADAGHGDGDGDGDGGGGGAGDAAATGEHEALHALRDDLRRERDELRAERDVLAARVRSLEHDLQAARTTMATERRTWSERSAHGAYAPTPHDLADDDGDDDDEPDTPTTAMPLAGPDWPTTAAADTTQELAGARALDGDHGEADDEDEDEDDYEHELFTPPYRAAPRGTGPAPSALAVVRWLAVVLLLVVLLVVGYVIAGGLR